MSALASLATPATEDAPASTPTIPEDSLAPALADSTAATPATVLTDLLSVPPDADCLAATALTDLAYAPSDADSPAATFLTYLPMLLPAPLPTALPPDRATVRVLVVFPAAAAEANSR